MAVETTHFLNVDLEIDSRSDLQPLVSVLGKKVDVLYVGRHQRTYMARLELARRTANPSPDSIVRGFCALIRTLPKAERQLWNTAKVRDFSIGVQAGASPNPYDLTVAAETVKSVSELDARIVFTLYPSDNARVDRMTDPDIDYSDIPPLDDSFSHKEDRVAFRISDEEGTLAIKASLTTSLSDTPATPSESPNSHPPAPA